MRAMCKLMRRAAAVATLLTLPTILQSQTASDAPVSARARQFHQHAIVIDTHDDTTQRLISDRMFDIGTRNASGSIDIPRMREGGLDALFFSIWIPGDVTGPQAIKQALQQIDAVREAVRRHPSDLTLATSVAEIRRAAAAHKIAALMGVEGGHMIGQTGAQRPHRLRPGGCGRTQSAWPDGGHLARGRHDLFRCAQRHTGTSHCVAFVSACAFERAA
jgi:hypothetical protein